MSKLTTERLEKFVNDIKTDGMCDITDSQVESALIRLLAYEQAADRPVGEIFRCSGNKTLRWWNDVPEGTVLYAAPVIPEQAKREQVRREHAEWSDATFGDVGPVGPLKHLSKEALEAAADPSDSLEWADMQFLLWDAQRRMGISDDFITKAMIEKLEINKKRQWPEPKDGEPRLHINTQSAQPVSEPYKLPVGYFSYGSECGFDWHNTEKEAIEAAEAVIDDYRGDACDGWSEETDSVCWGVILQQATKVDERPRTDDDKCDPAIDTVCDYALLPELVGNSPVIPDGWKLVPIEPTENMIIDGFESEPDEDFSEPDDWEEYAAMSGCEQAAHRAKLCWAAMLAAAPAVEGDKA